MPDAQIRPPNDRIYLVKNAGAARIVYCSTPLCRKSASHVSTVRSREKFLARQKRTNVQTTMADRNAAVDVTMPSPRERIQPLKPRLSRFA